MGKPTRVSVAPPWGGLDMEDSTVTEDSETSLTARHFEKSFGALSKEVFARLSLGLLGRRRLHRYPYLFPSTIASGLDPPYLF